MTNRYLTDLADVLRDAGLKVVEVPGWRTRGRPHSTGRFDPIGNLWHHTGAKDTNPLSIADDRAYADWLAEIGRSDLPAPLCQVSIGRDGTCYVCAAGRGNHAGDARPTGPMPGGDGNELYLGWECQNDGTEGWSPAQYAAMVTAGAATSAHYGWAAAANRAHRETSLTGKWDPGRLDMDRFRTDIANHQEDPMAQFTEDEIRKYVREETTRVVDKRLQPVVAKLDRAVAKLKKLVTKENVTQADVRAVLAELTDGEGQ